MSSTARELDPCSDHVDLHKWGCWLQRGPSRRSMKDNIGVKDERDNTRFGVKDENPVAEGVPRVKEEEGDHETHPEGPRVKEEP
uniref:Uncharacterized protein n=1 Tax=Chromera velia CCMP2878 TaxID=1169474 RepID=A0A0G4GR59_9ALVE|eukprot:Cvel_22969.t1-p1 / transcript=Cvel_22969.t1 / gene=Cvel_22969 / organism=Chromera_velia_CCMP2878 / gene_product=hypothetical protein / transcript_product=hypothetical protein / location=Cvel_scaffold2315:6554-6802(+) / protein_length=83 / sequence_SO=supercontig / SO=protein_coding / is_pseudo=false